MNFVSLSKSLEKNFTSTFLYVSKYWMDPLQVFEALLVATFVRTHFYLLRLLWLQEKVS